MLELILLPFKLAWEVLCFAFNLVSGLFGLVFGLIGGAIELIVSLAGIAIIISLIALAIQRRHPRQAEQEDFTSFYAQDGKVE